MWLKSCPKCTEEKPYEDFSPDKRATNGLHTYCKLCNTQTTSERRKTKAGLITKIYACQKKSSKKRNHPEPTYSNEELQEWCFSQKIFHELYDNWKLSGFKEENIPSCDRICDEKPYILENLRITTWEENSKKESKRQSKKVSMWSLDGSVFLGSFISSYEASRQTGIAQPDISAVCLNKRKMAGGCVWRYEEPARNIKELISNMDKV